MPPSTTVSIIGIFRCAHLDELPTNRFSIPTALLASYHHTILTAKARYTSRASSLEHRDQIDTPPIIKSTPYHPSSTSRSHPSDYHMRRPHPSFSSATLPLTPHHETPRHGRKSNGEKKEKDYATLAAQRSAAAHASERPG